MTPELSLNALNTMNYKLSPDAMKEINDLMESAQDDLEGVLFRLVAERELAREARAIIETLNDCLHG